MHQHSKSTGSATLFMVVILVFLSLYALLFPSMGSAGQLESAEFSQEIDAFVQTQMERHGIVGLAVTITQDDQLLYVGAYGQADERRPVEASTPFYLGSVTKSFTALAVMQLVDAGKLKLDAPVQRYIPWFRVADALESQTITVRDLLNQTSGLSRTSVQSVDLKREAGLEQAVRTLQDARLSATPGTRFQYANENYTILGLLIEEVSGQSYDEYMRDHIFTPLDMQTTFTKRASAEQAGLAQGYNTFFGFPFARPQPHLRYDLPAGFMISSAQDLSHYLIAQLNRGIYQGRQVVSRNSLALMHQSPDDIPGNYAMGWEQVQIEGHDAIRHDGTLETFYSSIILLPESDTGIALLINQVSFAHMALAYNDITAGILKILTGSEPQTGFSTRTANLIFALVAFASLSLQVREILQIQGWQAKAARQKPWQVWLSILWKVSFGLIALIVLPWILIASAGLQVTRVSFLNYMPDVTLWVALMAALSLVEGLRKGLLFLRQRNTAHLGKCASY